MLEDQKHLMCVYNCISELFKKHLKLKLVKAKKVNKNGGKTGTQLQDLIYKISLICM